MKKVTSKKKRKQKFLKIYIEITNICNLNCKFCSEVKRNKKSMTIEEFEDVIKKVREYTNLVCLHVKGEPLVHENLDKLLEICDKYELKVNITTNGILIEKWKNLFKKARALRQLNISLHSAEQNESIDQEKYLEYVFSTVEEIRKENDVIISYRLWNINELEKNEINKKIFSSLENFYKIKKIEKRAKKEKFIELRENLFLNQDYKFEWPDIEREKITEKGKCYGLRNQLGILVDGTIVPCCLDGNGDINLGNIFKVADLKEILETERAKNIVEGFKCRELREELCQKCGFIKRFDYKEDDE